MALEPSIQAQIDQAIASINDTIAPLIAGFYRKMIDEGLPKDVAIKLSETMTSSIMGSMTEKYLGKVAKPTRG